MMFQYSTLAGLKSLAKQIQAEQSVPRHDALDLAAAMPGGRQIWIIGGAEIYREALPHTDELWLTLVDAEKDCDTFFPEGYEELFPRVISAEPLSSETGITATYLRLGQ